MSTTEPLKPAIDRARLEFSKDLAQEIQRIEEEHGDEYGCNASGLASLLLPFIESRRPAAAHAPMEGEAPDVCTCFDECRMGGLPHTPATPVPARPEVEGETPECDAFLCGWKDSLQINDFARSLERRLLAALRSPAAGACAVCCEAADYLDTNHFTTIGHGSKLHLQMREASAAPSKPTRPNWQCGKCRSFFYGRHKEKCPECGTMGYWCGSFKWEAPATTTTGEAHQ